MESSTNLCESLASQSKLIRTTFLKRGQRNDDKTLRNRIKLETVFGLTVYNRSSVACDSKTALFAYPAGCAVVLFNFQSNTQSFIGSETIRKNIVCLAFSKCGRYLATGEIGHQPAVRVWDLYHGDSVKINPVQIAEHQTHYHSVNCVIFSPNGRFLVSIGSQHDMVVIVWDWRNDKIFARSKVSTKIRAVDFAASGSYFVTVGKRHVKFWYLEDQRSKIFKETSPLLGRSAILGELKNNYFCDVACEKPLTLTSLSPGASYMTTEESQLDIGTFAITRSGCLCKFDDNRIMAQWVKLKTTRANCLVVSQQLVFIGCSDSIIRCFHASSLQYVTTLPLTHHLGVDISRATNIEYLSSKPLNAKYPDCEAIAYDSNHSKLCCVYNDHSIYIWDVNDINHVGKSYSNLYHSTHIWDIELIKTNTFFATDYFFTCSYDNTLRLWCLSNRDSEDNPELFKKHSIPDWFKKSNVYSENLRKIIYLDDELVALKEHNISVPANGTVQPIAEADTLGIRCIKLSPDNIHLACGLRNGNVLIYGIKSVPVRELYQIEAHECEVYSLDYSSGARKLLATAGKDRVLHVFDMQNDYELVQTLDDHSSLITSVKFLVNEQQLYLISCGCDQSIIIRKMTKEDDTSSMKFVRVQNVVHRMTLYDLVLDPNSIGQVYVACHDKKIRVHDIESGKHLRSIKNSRSEESSTTTYIIRLTLDRTGTFIAAASFDKTVTIFDTLVGETVAIITGYSDLITGLKFSNDCRRLITVSVRGCIFVWRLANDLVIAMQAKLPIETDDQVNFRFSLGQLPVWAAKRLAPNYESVTAPEPKPLLPKGRWGQRFIQGVTGDSNTFDTEGSTDSGIESNRTLDVEKTRRIEEFLKRTAEFSNEQCSFSDHMLDTASNDSEHKVYFLQSEAFSRSEFPVTAIDKEELRKSVRRKNKANFMQVLSANQMSADVDDFEDEEEENLSTPPLSSEPTTEERNPNLSSFFSVSAESLDQLTTPYEDHMFSQITLRQKQSSSSKALVNFESTITKKNEGAVIQRLQKRINETIRTVANVGTKSKGQKIEFGSNNDTKKIRRSISLSDLNETVLSPSDEILTNRQKSQKTKPKLSLSVFNQNLMKPTISSQNKINAAAANKSKNLRQYRSELNLSRHQDDSSSEEMNTKFNNRNSKSTTITTSSMGKRVTGANYRKPESRSSSNTVTSQWPRLKQCQEICDNLNSSTDSIVKLFHDFRNLATSNDYESRAISKLLHNTLQKNFDKFERLRLQRSDDESD